MMYPLAVQGYMPFVEEYRDTQIKKVLDKERSRHHSGPDSRVPVDKSAKHKNTHSMPILWQSVYAGQRPRFRSMSALDDSRNGLNATRHSLVPGHPEKTSKSSILSSIKKIFSHKKEDESQPRSQVRTSKHSTSSSSGISGAIVQGNQSRPYTSINKKPADHDIVGLTGVRNAKRQRMRTLSNISGVMETIEEVNEIMASTDHLSDEDSSLSSSDETIHSIASAPNVSSTSLLYSCSNLSNFSDSSSSHHGSADLVCVA